MLAVALLLLAGAAASLVAGVVADEMRLVHASIWAALLAAALLAAGVARSRPRRHAHGPVAAPTWSGASQEAHPAPSDPGPAEDGGGERLPGEDDER